MVWAMAHAVRILMLVHDAALQQRLQQELGPWAVVTTQLGEAMAVGGIPQLIVTDRLPITDNLEEIARQIGRGEVGILGLGTPSGADVVLPSDCHPRELQLACRLLAEVIELRCRLADEQRTQDALRRMAFRDPLTGLPNRRSWDRELVGRLEQLRDGAERAVLGVVLLDVDLFKPVNDQLGLVGGDTALQRIAQKLAANLAQQHLAARLGGDEFGILVADLLRRSIELQPDASLALSRPVTSSAGVVIVTGRHQASARNILTAAGEALRRAKQDGRNRTHVCPLY